MKLLNVPFLILILSLIIGILLGYYYPLQSTTLIVIIIITFLSLAVSWFRARTIFRNSSAFTLFSIFAFALFGMALVFINNPKNQPDHYTNLSIEEEATFLEKDIQFTVLERLKPSTNFHKYVVSVDILNKQYTTGNLLVLVPKNQEVPALKIGDIYTTIAVLQPIKKPLNPYQFNYASFLEKQYIYHQISIAPTMLMKSRAPKWSVYRVADQIRLQINHKLRPYSFTNAQLSIMNALLLGQRQDLDQDIFEDYQDAGAVHLLAVSGLHVGVFLLIFNFILTPLNYLGQKGVIIKTSLCILLLWCFAIIAGLSPSVLRAVTMFSFLAIGLQIRSKTSTYNSLLISLFILLCFNPLLLFSVGFQLSYLAVFTILWIQPLLFSYYKPHFKLDKVLWETGTVTVAAQFGLLPLTLYYFHQFPLLFFIANIIIIPLLGTVLGFGLLILFLAQIGYLPPLFVDIFGGFIDGMNAIVHWVAEQESFLITDISFSWRLLVICYILMTTFILTLKKFTVARFYSFAISILIALVLLTTKKWNQSTKEELVIFHAPRNTIIGVQLHQELKIYSTDSIPKKTKHYVIRNYLVHDHVQLISEEKLENVYSFKEKKILIIDSSGRYQIPNFHPDIVILSNAPKIHLQRMLYDLKPTLVIADGNNYRSHSDRWEITCKQEKIPFHRTDQNGAFILK